MKKEETDEDFPKIEVPAEPSLTGDNTTDVRAEGVHAALITTSNGLMTSLEMKDQRRH